VSGADAAANPKSGGGLGSLLAPFRLSLRHWLLASAPLIAVALALLAGAGFILAIGEDPFAVYALMLRETLGTGYGIGQTLFKATPLIFCGLAVAVGFRAGLFNIGAEGQLTVAAFAAALAGTQFVDLPHVLLLPLILLVAIAAGAAWGAVPGVLKARFGSHEVINTIMLNFIAFALVSYLGRGVFQPATVRTAEIGAWATLPRLDAWFPALRGSPANLSLLLALLAAVAVGVVLFRTRLGFEVRALGLNATAARYGGVPVGATQVRAMAISGALAGLAGMNFVLGYKHFFELGFSAGAGFMGIAVALLGRNHPAGVVLAALFFGALSHGGLAISQRVPKELVDILQAIVILLAICVHQVVERAARRLEA
jgi:general nucleoside transport system permease protein